MYSLVYSCWHVIIAQYFVEIFFYLDLLYIYTSCMTLILTMLTFISVFFFFLEQWMVNGEICVGLFAIRDIKKVCLHLPSINSLSTHGWSHQSLLLCWLAGVFLFLPVNCICLLIEILDGQALWNENCCAFYIYLLLSELVESSLAHLTSSQCLKEKGLNELVIFMYET